MFKKHFITLSFIFSTFFVVSQNTLQYNFETGDTFSVLQESTQIINQTIMGEDQKIKNELGGIMKFTVTDVTNDNYTIAMQFTKFYINMSSPSLGELMNVDTSKEPNKNDVQSMLFHGLLNQELTFVMTRDGDISSLKGTEQLIDAMLKKANINTPAIIDNVKVSLKNDWNDGTLTNSIEQVLFLYGDSKISKDATWQNEYTGNVSAKSNWKIDAIEGNTVDISAKSEIEMNTKNAQMSMSLTGTQTTKARVDAKTGLFSIIETSGKSNGKAISAQLPDSDIPVVIDFKHIYKTIN